ncbi:PREDICTED: LOW QUALITY PROTEIN: probable tubulin polyglutamylase TTLL9 [Cyprinodon variegatus]|uniref:LOW QUALITY PROTEIN: probable tubulin polyglutamylase TTLL9 n=1 Tax=Cyprinodon variegatus TaxID=28743 RepID=UPI0007429BBC|nr:PREDICTED: LOW QUALITY PROTEIN: probable tubulin polyglutamylase TTLL9 [Cyprinodon variegatus]
MAVDLEELILISAASHLVGGSHQNHIMRRKQGRDSLVPKPDPLRCLATSRTSVHKGVSFIAYMGVEVLQQNDGIMGRGSAEPVEKVRKGEKEKKKKNLEKEVGTVEASKCDFFPQTFVLLSEYHLFVEENKRSPGSIWIMKPIRKSHGKGIFLFRKLKDIIDWEKESSRREEQKDSAHLEMYMVQRYIENPYLINGRKFDLRVYVLSMLKPLNIHLTNVSVQKTASDYDPEKVIINDKHCFELYGYDILLDQNLKQWLIEVNASPSYLPSNQEDYEMKYRLLEDTLNIIDTEGRLTGQEKRVGGYDLMRNNGPVYREDVGLETFDSSCFYTNTYLGCANDREKQLGHIFKPLPFQKKV